MAKGLDAKELRRLAQIGAQARLADIDCERENLLRVFPGLRPGRVEPSRRIGNLRSAVPRKRSKMSAAARKAVSVRMKKYWANRLATAGKRRDAQ